ncbi:MAG TPA: methyltransferase domain-containing protein [Steroidobacteraceae bacterium]|jgi:SAM-dependent methyltransferase|nr:methyltransferase domain-containing protein [Steroidobacteraceae bacterium]
MGTWDYYGRHDPYFGVLSHDRYHSGALSEDARREFFESGAAYVRDVLDSCRRHLGPELPREKALDFGCGVGRLTLPLAGEFAHVVGVDVAAGMLTEARAQAAARQLRNVTFCQTLEELVGAHGTFSFVNSYIVLQHVPTRDGLAYIATMLRLLGADGFGALHVTYARAKDKSNYGLRSIGSRAGRLVAAPLSSLGRKLRGREPKMAMNPYNLNQVIFMLQDCGVNAVHAQLTNHGGHLGAILLFAKRVR